MGDYDATLLGAISRFGLLKKYRLYALYCTSDDPEITADRSAKFEDRLMFLINLGFVALEGDTVTYLGSL
jgi:hypothetical protein